MAGMAKFASFKNSYSWALYERAIGRIWSGKFIFIVWGLLWSAAAAYFAFWLFDFVPDKVENLAFPFGEYGFLAITPIIVGWAVSRSYVFEGRAYSSLKTVPLSPFQALIPRMLAVFLTWIEFALPFAIVYLLALNSVLRFSADMTLTASMPDLRIILIERFIFMGVEYGGYKLIDLFSTSTDALPLFYCVIFIEVLGYGILPISWGFLWGTKLKQRGGQFFLVYIAYALIPAALLGIIRFYPALYDYLINRADLSLVLLVNPGWLVFSIIFMFLAFREWGRRSG
jgi:hypothetical protein